MQLTPRSRLVVGLYRIVSFCQAVLTPLSNWKPQNHPISASQDVKLVLRVGGCEHMSRCGPLLIVVEILRLCTSL